MDLCRRSRHAFSRNGTIDMTTTMETLPPVRAILYDWGDTLVRPPGITTHPKGHFNCVQRFFEADLQPALSSAGGTSLEWPVFRDAYLEATMDLVRHTIRTGREHSFAMRVSATLARCGQPDILDESACRNLADALGRYIALDTVPIEGARETVIQQAARFRIGLLSNYPHARTVRESLAASGILAHLHEVVISADIGWSKPARQAFDAALKALDTPPESILFVGDDLENDMRGAKVMGMQTAWLPRADQHEIAAGAIPEFVDIRLETIGDLVALPKYST